jgi:hypothetical protein
MLPVKQFYLGHILDAKAPELQFNNLLAGKYPRYLFGNYYSVPMYPAFVGIPSKLHQREGHPIKVISLDRAMEYMREEYDACKIIRLDDSTHKRLMDFAKSEEPILDLINRLLDTAEAKK